jgi:Family of unknown function (DUF6229)
MLQTDDIISSWLNGSDSEGYDSPAGPLYTEGQAATEAALTNPGLGKSGMLVVTVGKTTCSIGRGCSCC